MERYKMVFFYVYIQFESVFGQRCIYIQLFWQLKQCCIKLRCYTFLNIFLIIIDGFDKNVPQYFPMITWRKIWFCEIKKCF